MSHTGFLYLNSLRFVRLDWSQLYHVVEMLKVFTLRIKASRHFQNLGSTDQPVTAHSLKKPKTSAWSLPIESSISLQLQDIPTSIILIVLDQFISCTTSEKYLIHLSVIEPCILTARPKNKLYSILRSQTGRLKLGYNPAKWTGSGHLRLIISQVQYDLINGSVEHRIFTFPEQFRRNFWDFVPLRKYTAVQTEVEVKTLICLKKLL